MSKFLNQVSENDCLLTSSMRKTLCNSLIQCHSDYACSSWYSSLSKYFQKRLQVTPNKVVRFINKYNPRSCVRSSDLSKLGMLNVEHSDQDQDQDQDSLLVKRRNDNHSPGPVIRELVPSSHQRSELSNTILCSFSG